jgi:CheY-like chemotaxis protein
MDVMPEMDGLEAARRIRVAEALVGDARTYMLALKANAQSARPCFLRAWMVP